MIPEFIKVAPNHLEKLCDMRINCFGHLGDGNLHYNVFPPKGRDKKEFWNLRDEIKRTVHDLVVSMGGSHSAEHGIGRLKVDDLERYSDSAKLSALHAIKGALDPQNILNPGSVLRR
jgi:FAD/FMN-containing dehydrogenase